MEPVRLGNHELLCRLASGGAANVFLVRDLASPKRDRLLALKILLPALASNEDFLNMFFTEARIASRLKHKNVVSIAGFGQVDGIHCLAMEYVFGASLSQVLRASAKAKKPLTVGVLLRITAAVCDALHFAHEMNDDAGESMGLVHRDVTPQNILIGFDGIPKLTDFGIAKATGRGWETQAGIVKGKFSYMSPEQALGKRVDRRSDIFGTGIVLWEALTGRDLFRGSSPMEVLSAIREQKIEPPSKVVPGLTPIVDPIVMKALRRSPRQRYQTSAEMRDDILDLIRRAGVEIDANTISKEFYSIYGDEIGVRAVELRKAMAGKSDLDALADALGGHPLSQKQLPKIGGATHPDPLGLFTDETGAPKIQPSPAAVREMTGMRPDHEAVEMVSEIQPRRWSAEGSEPGAFNDWNELNVQDPDEDQLLSLLSEEDATVGILPQAFAKHFGAQLQEARREEQRQLVNDFADEATVGVGSGGAHLSKLRSITDEPSDVWADSPAFYDAPPPGGLSADLQGPPAAPPAADGRAIPRAPSLSMEDEPDKTRPFPRAPSLIIEEYERTPSPQIEPNAKPATTSAEGPPPTGDVAPPRRSGLHLSWPVFLLYAIGLLAAGFLGGLVASRWLLQL